MFWASLEPEILQFVALQPGYDGPTLGRGIKVDLKLLSANRS